MCSKQFCAMNAEPDAYFDPRFGIILGGVAETFKEVDCDIRNHTTRLKMPNYFLLNN